jgi:DNA polymerase V
MKTQGGKRANAGRKAGSNVYGETTTPLRIPNSQISFIKDYLKSCTNKQASEPFNSSGFMRVDKTLVGNQALPLYSSKVPAGFPSPADDHIEKRLNINDYLIQQADATFLVTISGLSMRDAGLLPKDIAVVDRSKVAAIGNIVVAIVDGEFTIKTLGLTEKGSPLLIPANPDFQPIEITESMQFEIWGVVTGSIRKFI